MMLDNYLKLHEMLSMSFIITQQRGKDRSIYRVHQNGLFLIVFTGRQNVKGGFLEDMEFL